MSIANCIKGTNLEKKVNSKIEAGVSEYKAVREVLIEEYGNLSDRLNSLRQDVGLPTQELSLETVDVEAMQRQFDSQIEAVNSREYALPQEPIETIAEVVDIRKEKTAVKHSANFTGNFEYLTTDFVSDFYIEMLKEREKNSEIYKNFYSNFDVNENGIYLKNDDSITMSQIREYADENLKQYSIISKQMPLLVEQDIQSETKQVRRDAILNNPQNLEKYQGQFHKLNDNTLITKNVSEEFIKVEGNVFEAVDSDGNLTLYSRLNNAVGEYYNFNNKTPKSSVKIEDYSYLNTQPEKFMTEKKYLSKSAKEKINQENFDCI